MPSTTGIATSTQVKTGRLMQMSEIVISSLGRIEADCSGEVSIAPCASVGRCASNVESVQNSAALDLDFAFEVSPAALSEEDVGEGVVRGSLIVTMVSLAN